MKQIITSLFMLAVSGLLLLPTHAQDVTPQYIVDAARRIAEADLPSLGEATGWSHTILNSITTTSLGCALVDGVPLPNPVDVYRLEIEYSNTSYSVHVTTDASMVVLCDERFPSIRAGVIGANNTTDPTRDTDGDGIPNADDICPSIAGISGGNQSGCPIPSEGDRDGDSVADSIDFCPDQAGARDSDGCPILTDTDGDSVPNATDLCPSDAGVTQDNFAIGCPLDGTGSSPSIRLEDSICRVVGDNITLYDNAASNANPIGTLNATQADADVVIGRSSVDGFVQTNSGWVNTASVRLTGDCFNIPIVNASIGSATGCFMRANDTFANVRNNPTPNSPQISTIYPNESYAVLGTNLNADWVFFNQGWVTTQVIDLFGTCDSLPLLDPQYVGSGSIFFCPPNYTGYLEPRISIGTPNARIAAGIAPNRLRSEPTATSEQIGEIPNGQTLDAIVDGPACNEGYVWWQVNVDGVVGWTVESDINGNAYYIEPFDASGNVVESGAQPTPAMQTPSQEANPSTFQMITSANSSKVNTIVSLAIERPQSVTWSPVNSMLAVISDTQGLSVYSYPTFAEITAQLSLPNTLHPTAVAFSHDERFLAIGNADGRVYIAELQDNASIGGVFLSQTHTSPVHAIAWAHTHHALASASGDTIPPVHDAEWTLKVWDVDGFSPATQPQAELIMNYAYPYPLTDVTFSRDDAWVAVTGETHIDQQAAIWIYNTDDTLLYFSKGLVYMQGFSAVTSTPLDDIGDFVYNNGNTAYRITVATEDDVLLYRESDKLLNTIAFRNQIITGAEALMAVTNASVSNDVIDETVTFLNVLNADSPSASLTVSTTDIAFSPDGRFLAVADDITNRVILLGVTDS
jgi:WD40 repeat protein